MPRKQINSENYNKALPSRLRDLMKGTTQQELADYLGKTRQAISYYLDGSSSPDWETIVKLANYFDVSTDYLLGVTTVKSTNMDIKAAVELTGLSEKSINILSQTWDGLHLHKEETRALDILIDDMAHENNTDNRKYRSILALIYFFLSYSNSNQEKDFTVDINGAIIERDKKNSGYAYNGIKLDRELIENSVLVEMQNALKNLKNTHRNDEVSHGNNRKDLR